MKKHYKKHYKKHKKSIHIAVFIIAILAFFLLIFKQTGDANMDNTNTDNANTNNVILETNKGNIEIELYPNKSPLTVENFINYVKKGHYDGTVFHRVINDFMIQGGGFTPDGNQKPVDLPIKLESNNGLTNDLGTIAMARTMIQDSATSQFFINVKDNDFLNYAPGNPGYAVFGKAVSGMEIVNQIKSVKTITKNGMGDWPVEDIIIEKAYIK